MSMKRLSSLFATFVVLLVCSSPVLAKIDTTDNSGSVLSLVGTIICGGLCFMILIACSIYALYFLYTDAENRSGNGILWLLLGLFIGWPWVLIVWLIIRPERRV